MRSKEEEKGIAALGKQTSATEGEARPIKSAWNLHDLEYRSHHRIISPQL